MRIRHLLILTGLACVSAACEPKAASSPTPSPPSALPPTAQASVTPSPQAPRRLCFSGDQGQLLLEVLDDDLVHAQLSEGDCVAPLTAIDASPMVARLDYTGPLRFEFDGQHTLRTGELEIVVDPATLCLTATRTGPLRVRLTTLCPYETRGMRGLSLTPETFTHAYGLGENFVVPGETDGEWVGRDRVPGRYGNVQASWNQGAVGNDQYPIAYFAGAGTESYALFVDLPEAQYWSLRGSSWSVTAQAPATRFYLLAGADLADLRQDYMELTGRPPVPPRSAFGLWISEYGFDNWAELEDKLTSLRLHRFPVDGFVLDLQWYGGIVPGSDDTLTGRMDWATPSFSDAAAVIGRLQTDDGVSLIAIEQPYVGRNRAEHEILAEQGYLVRECEACDPVYLTANPWWGRGGMIDFTNPEASAFWHDLRRQPLIEDGLIGHWTDLGEPELFDPAGWYVGPPDEDPARHDHAQVHNLYNLLWSQGIAEGYERNGVMQRVFILSRSGTSGSQRYGVTSWSGDISGLLSSLATHLNVQMHMSLSGIDYYGSDIGGFHRQPGDQAERYTQWFADGMAIDIPGRVHTFNVDNTRETAPDRIGDRESNLQNVRLRYALIPYLYSLAHRAYQFGEPVVPPLVYYYQSDPNVRDLGAEKLLGRDLLVVTVAEDGAQQVPVYLPQGRWVDLHSGVWIDSRGEWVDAVPLYRQGRLTLPLYARAGAIVPMMFVDDQTMNAFGRRLDGSRRDELILRVFADPTPTTFTHYEDDGRTIAYQDGAMRTTSIHQQELVGRIEVVIEASIGDYDGAVQARANVIRLQTFQPVQLQAVELNGEPLPRLEPEQLLDPLVPGWCMTDEGEILVNSGSLRVDIEKAFTFLRQD